MSKVSVVMFNEQKKIQKIQLASFKHTLGVKCISFCVFVNTLFILKRYIFESVPDILEIKSSSQGKLLES